MPTVVTSANSPRNMLLESYVWKAASVVTMMAAKTRRTSAVRQVARIWGWDGMGWDGMGLDWIGWEGTGRDGKGWYGMVWVPHCGMEWKGMGLSNHILKTFLFVKHLSSHRRFIETEKSAPTLCSFFEITRKGRM